MAVKGVAKTIVYTWKNHQTYHHAILQGPLPHHGDDLVVEFVNAPKHCTYRAGFGPGFHESSGGFYVRAHKRALLSSKKPFIQVMTQHPEVLWAQRSSDSDEEKVRLLFSVPVDILFLLYIEHSFRQSQPT